MFSLIEKLIPPPTQHWTLNLKQRAEFKAIDIQHYLNFKKSYLNYKFFKSSCSYLNDHHQLYDFEASISVWNQTYSTKFDFK